MQKQDQTRGNMCFHNAYCNEEAAASDKNNGLKESDAHGINIDICVDPRVELMSVIFRLAGNNEYTQCQIPEYDKDIEAYFKPYKNHPAVKFAVELRKSRGVSFDAPMSMAVHLTDANAIKELVPFKPHPPRLDRRWHYKEAEKFLEKARQFVKDTNFIGFFNEHKAFYDETVKTFKDAIRQNAHFEWFDEFFGDRGNVTFHVILGMANGGPSYGASVILDGRQYMYSIPGVWLCDTNGKPAFNEEAVNTLFHEFCHSYTNPIAAKFESALEPAGKILYPEVEPVMKRQAYGSWQTMIKEYIVRICIIQYYRKYQTPQDVKRLLRNEVSRGFIDMRELDEVVSKYESQRDKYPTFESFFPKVVDFFNEYSKNLYANENQ
ncbi:MAG: DUF4932 domain-containing protein [Sedimentisphaerales bacterium]|nr:DUF4932 domain-containing protein [Sedimentisphaerales bacterium]